MRTFFLMCATSPFQMCQCFLLFPVSLQTRVGAGGLIRGIKVIIEQNNKKTKLKTFTDWRLCSYNRAI